MLALPFVLCIYIFLAKHTSYIICRPGMYRIVLLFFQSSEYIIPLQSVNDIIILYPPPPSCDVSLMYPPYMIALACIHMAAVVTKKDVKTWFVELSVDMEKILEITTQILDLYKLWKKYDEAKEVPDLLARIPKPKFVKSPSPTEALKAKSTPSPKK